MKNLKIFLLVIALSVVSVDSSNADINANDSGEQRLSRSGNNKEFVEKFRTKQMYAGKIEGGMYEKFSGKNIPVRPKLLWYLDC